MSRHPTGEKEVKEHRIVRTSEGCELQYRIRLGPIRSRWMFYGTVGFWDKLVPAKFKNPQELVQQCRQFLRHNEQIPIVELLIVQ